MCVESSLTSVPPSCAKAICSSLSMWAFSQAAVTNMIEGVLFFVIIVQKGFGRPLTVTERFARQIDWVTALIDWLISQRLVYLFPQASDKLSEWWQFSLFFVCVCFMLCVVSGLSLLSFHCHWSFLRESKFDLSRNIRKLTLIKQLTFDLNKMFVCLF